MSGIVGILNLDGAPVDRELLEEMTELMAFRGPDGRSAWLNGAIGLGCALLRTTFEAEGEQGPCSLDGRVWIAADARLDGRAKLLDELRAQGQTPADDSPDPELILHAYHAWGAGCLERLVGDFAFALWDGGQERLFCARDHFGVTPFYYAHVGGNLVFGNTLDAVGRHPGVSDALNEQAIGDYLVFRSCHDLNATFFADVRRLPPAHVLSWSAGDGAPHLERYWALPQMVEYARYRNPDEYVERYRELFRQAVADRLRADSVSVAMSGGMDSPAVAAVAQAELTASGQPFQMHLWTITHSLFPYEEDRYAKMVADELGLPTHFLDVDTRLEQEMPKQAGQISPEPNFIFSFWLNPWGMLWTRAAAAGRVLLTGHGGDPGQRAWSGYWFDLLKRGQPGRLIQEIGQYCRTHSRRPPLYLRTNLSRWLKRRPPRQIPGWIDADFAARLELQARLEEQGRRFGNHDGLQSMAANPFWSNFLTSFDPDSTQLPLKVRFPFFDLRLVSYLLTVPPVPWFERKRLLRETMRGVLPEAVRQRRKILQGANPLETFARQQGSPAYLAELAAAPELAPYVDQETLLRVVGSPGQVPNAVYRSAIKPIILAYWLQERQRFGLPRG